MWKPSRLAAGVPGVLHGSKTYLIQDKAGQIIRRTRSVRGSITLELGLNTLHRRIAVA